MNTTLSYRIFSRQVIQRMAVLLILVTVVANTQAQNNREHQLRIHSNGMVIYSANTESVDSLTATDSYQLQLFHNGGIWSRAIDNIDSLTFAYVSSGASDYSDTAEVDYNSGISITWNNGGTPTIVNGYASQGVTITTSGEHVTVTSTATTAGLTYRLSGTSSNGSLTISSDYRVVLLLDGLTLTHPSGAAIRMLSDKRCSIHLNGGTINTVADGSGSTMKGAIQTQGKLDFQGSGSLRVSGYAKHGIQSSGRCAVLSGDITVTTAEKDGMNVDDLIMYGGTLTVNSLGDGIDGDQGLVEILGGTITVTTSGDDTKAISCDSTMHIGGGDVTLICTGADAKGLRTKQSLLIDGGNVEITLSGDQSKGVKSDRDYTHSGGTLSVTASGSVVLESSTTGTGYDPSYCTGVKVGGSFYLSDGAITVLCPSSNIGGKALSCDGNVTLSGGTMDITVSGACGTYTDSTGSTNDYASTGIKSDGALTVTGGAITVAAYGKALSADGDITLAGGDLMLSTNGNGAVTVGSGRSATDGYASACVKTDGNMTVTGGHLQGSSTGKGGRGIVVDGTLTVGSMGAEDSLIHLYAMTSGAPVNASSGGPGGGGPGGGPGGSGSSDYWKGLPKAFKVAGNITIYSGHVQAYCAQTSGDPTGEAIETKDSLTINGGYIECNAYDDAINAGVHIAINDGHIWAYSRGNDALDCNGTYIHVNGGIIIAYGAECGIDDNADNGGTHLYINNATMVCSGQRMGAIEGTPSVSGQKYLQINSTSLMQSGFCIKHDNDPVLTFRMGSVSGSGFVATDDAKRVNGTFITSPVLTENSYSYYTSFSTSGGSNWHGLFSDTTVTTTGNGSSVTAH